MTEVRFRTVPPLHRRSTLALLVLLGGVFGGAPAAAQQLPLKRTVPASAGGGCLGAPPLAQPTSQAR
ncbi:MAG: hypothetical protein M3409_04455, partial [Gemmatimonadota bacterium]|nr:hypothetical protein [Gemmatimonadota bacterium]